MPEPKRALSKERQVAWYAASGSWSLFLIWFVSERGLLRNPDTVKFELMVVVIVWIAVVASMRLVFRDMKDPSGSGRGQDVA